MGPLQSLSGEWKLISLVSYFSPALCHGLFLFWIPGLFLCCPHRAGPVGTVQHGEWQGDKEERCLLSAVLLSLLFVKSWSLWVLTRAQQEDRRKQSLLLLPVHQSQLFSSLNDLQLVVVSVIPDSSREEETPQCATERFLLSIAMEGWLWSAGSVLGMIFSVPRSYFQGLLRKAPPMLPHILGGEFLQSLKVLRMNRVIYTVGSLKALYEKCQDQALWISVWIV